MRPGAPDSWQHARVGMRIQCKHYETRSYATGETVRKCNLDLAPEAPWRCPEHCAAFAVRLADVNWQHGTLVTPPPPPEPPGLGDGSAAALLDEAENVINAALPKALAEAYDEDGRRSAGDDDRWWRRFGFGKRR